MLNAVVILAFTLPKAYELKKDEVDSFASQAHHHTKVSRSYNCTQLGFAFELVTSYHASPGCCKMQCQLFWWLMWQSAFACTHARTDRLAAFWSARHQLGNHGFLTGYSALQANYSKYVEPYVNKIPRASTSTTSNTPISNVNSTADSAPFSSEPKKVI